MTKQERGDFCFGFARESDGAIAFQCSDDAERWPWLRLHPAHNIAIQSTNYFSLTGVSLFAQSLSGEQWSALTSFSWRVHNRGEGAKHPVGGRATQEADGISYQCAFQDGDGAPVYDVAGAGVVFRNRDFESWRAKAKAEIAALAPADRFEFAAPGDVGVETHVEVYVSPVVEDPIAEDEAGPYVDALVTLENGFRPAHPYHGGSGDHVNSGHLCDAVQQGARLLGRSSYPSAGEATFTRYVELDRPFRLTCASQTAQKLVFEISQGPYKCATISVSYDD
ncbi:MAG: hypothetical protein AAGD92_12840 [Pseudomonadota bacterium]